MIIIGIDPGISGAVAFWDDWGGLNVFDMPILEIKRGTKAKRIVNAGLLAEKLKGLDGHAFIEMAQVRPENGASASFTTGRNYQSVLDAISFSGIPLTEVSSVKWKKALAVPADKDGARYRASQLLPQYSHYWNRKKDDGRAEAALIALYGQQQLNKTQGKS